MDDWTMPHETQRKTLERMKVGASIRQSMRVDVSEDVLRGELEHRLSAYVLADHLASDTFTAYTSSEWPDSTWQMFKSRHAGSWWLGWLVRRRPTRLHTERQSVAVEVKRYLAYPEANLDLPELGRPVIFEQVRQLD